MKKTKTGNTGSSTLPIEVTDLNYLLKSNKIQSDLKDIRAMVNSHDKAISKIKAKI
ncbi:MAG: hypothetical protein LWX07_04140 [Bacteroidetes bacterium]|nr:hypothetical protein [Bacteroidota bacterium]